MIAAGVLGHGVITGFTRKIRYIEIRTIHLTAWNAVTCLVGLYIC